MKTVFKIIAVALGLMLLLLFASIAVDLFFKWRATPPASMRTFDDFLAWQTKSRWLGLTQENGETFIVARGPDAGTSQSGPTVYVFDSSGRYLDWTTARGDDPPFDQKWPHASGAREISLQQAKVLISGRSSTNPAN
jgi:hypothetical protein